MASLIRGKKNYLVIQFRYRGFLCREYTGRLDNRDNRRSLLPTVRGITRELKDGSFDYTSRFPESRMLARFGLLPEKPTEPLTLAKQARIWLAAQEISVHTQRDYEYLFQVFLDRTPLGAMLLDKVTPDDIRAAVRSSTSTRRATMFLQRLRAIYNIAIDDALVEKNPALRVKNPKRRARQEPIEPWLTTAERLAIYNAADGADRAIIALVMGNGLRLGEALALRRRDVDFRTRTITIAGAVNRAHESSTKTEGSTRVLELIDNVLPVTAALRSYLNVPRLHGPLFATRSGKFIDLANWRERSWRAVMHRSSLPYRNPNTLRHSFAVAMLQTGYDAVHVARLMGHTNTQMIHRHYARWMGRKTGQSDQKSDQLGG